MFPPSAFNLDQHQGLFTSDGQSFEASALESVHPMNIQGWFPLELTGYPNVHRSTVYNSQDMEAT